MPGIVNIHTHVGGTLFKGLTEDIKGAFYGLAFPMERFITRESMYSISILGPWRPSNSAPPSSMTCTTSRNPPPARRRSWVCAASSHKRSTTQTCKTCTITIILRCQGRPPKSCRPNRYHCGVLAVRHHPGQYRRLQIRCLDRLFAGHPHGHLHRGVQGRRLELCRCKHPAFRHRPPTSSSPSMRAVFTAFPASSPCRSICLFRWWPIPTAPSA